MSGEALNKIKELMSIIDQFEADIHKNTASKQADCGQTIPKFQIDTNIPFSIVI